MMKENEQEKRETIADIVEIVRRAAQYYEGEAEKSEGLLRESFKLSAANYREIANRIEEAWKREKAEWEAAACACVSDAVMSGRVAVEHTPVGNAAARREALEKIRVIAKTFMDATRMRHVTDSVRIDVGSIEELANAALSAPLRNCDVGTVEEQGERCMAQFNRWRRKGDGRKLITAIMAWAQTPYEAEEGGAK